MAAVWRVLADIGAIHAWNPGVVRSHTTTAQLGGIGAERHCDLGGGNYLKEAVVTWEPERRLTMRIAATNLPFDAADIRFTLEARGDQTDVSVAPDYTLKFGPIGRLLDRYFVRARYQKGMRALLVGLKRHVERHAESAA